MSLVSVVQEKNINGAVALYKKRISENKATTPIPIEIIKTFLDLIH